MAVDTRAGWQKLLPDSNRKTYIPLFLIVLAAFLTFYWSYPIESRYHTTPIVSKPTISLKSSKFKIGKKVAAIIENRPSDNLIPLILHFSSVLGPDWPIVLFTSIHPSDVTKSAPFRAGIDSGQFSIQGIPEEAHFDSHKSVSAFLTKPWFWEQLAPADHVFFFQSDSIICANAPQKVEDFLKYDMIGAPIKGGMGQGYNGGLSLRNRKKVLDIIRNNDWEKSYEAAQQRKAAEAEWQRNRQAEIEAEEKAKAEKESAENGKPNDATDPGEAGPGVNGTERILRRGHTDVFPDNPTPPWEDYEDQWFFKRLTELPKKWNGDPGANLPGEDIAKTFAVETVGYDRPLGYHQVGVVITGMIEEVEKWCPEYHLCTDKRLPSAE